MATTNNTNEDLLPLSNMDDEELLKHVYITKERRSALEIELANRLEHLINETSKPSESLDELLGDD